MRIQGSELPRWETATVLPMWVQADLPVGYLVQPMPKPKYFDRTYQLSASYGTMGIGFVYGQLAKNARSSLDVLQKNFVAVFDSTTKREETRKEDFNFTAFVPGTENGWKEMKARRYTVTFHPEKQEETNVVDVLMVLDGKRRVWSLSTRYYVNDPVGKKAAERVMDSLRIFNKISVGSGEDTFAASADPKGKFEVRAKGSYLSMLGN